MLGMRGSNHADYIIEIKTERVHFYKKSKDSINANTKTILYDIFDLIINYSEMCFTGYQFKPALVRTCKVEV